MAPILSRLRASPVSLPGALPVGHQWCALYERLDRLQDAAPVLETTASVSP
ncbi:hypothetical protein ACWGDX_00900 [Streptomyces sp. NPDC055025]